LAKAKLFYGIKQVLIARPVSHNHPAKVKVKMQCRITYIS